MIASVLSIFPPRAWFALLLVVVLGVVILLVRYKWVSSGIWAELLRDIGIAFIVAGVVSAIYELSTRSIEEHETVLSTINVVMSSFIPDTVWEEVKQQILHRHAIRRGVEIDIRIRRSVRLANGEIRNMPEGKAALWMSYAYDLEGLSTTETLLPLQHELDYFMRDEALELPRFERVLIVGPDAEVQKLYEGPSLQKIYDGKGLIKLDGPDGVRLPPRNSGKRIRVITERTEIVNTPGYYYLVMRELTAHDENSSEPTVKVTIGEVPEDVDAKVETFYPPHSATVANSQKTVWTLDGTLLPGQGLTVVLTRRAKV